MEGPSAPPLLRLKGMSLLDLEALVRWLGYDGGEGGAGATARRLFRWIYHKVRKRCRVGAALVAIYCKLQVEPNTKHNKI